MTPHLAWFPWPPPHDVDRVLSWNHDTEDFEVERRGERWERHHCSEPVWCHLPASPAIGGTDVVHEEAEAVLLADLQAMRADRDGLRDEMFRRVSVAEAAARQAETNADYWQNSTLAFIFRTRQHRLLLRQDPAAEEIELAPPEWKDLEARFPASLGSDRPLVLLGIPIKGTA